MYCKKCGKLISDDSQYCSYCGTSQTFIEAGTSFTFNNSVSNVKSIFFQPGKKTVDKQKHISVPEGHIFCAYCGKVKSEDGFNKSRDVEFHRCKSCQQREKSIKWILVGLTLVALIFIALISLEDMGIEGLFVVFGLLVTGLAIIPGLLLYFLIDKILQLTPLRLSLSEKRKKSLLQLKDTNGNSIITPIVRNILEEKYRQETGHYRSRDIPLTHFRCPICDEIHPITEQNNVTGGVDRETSFKGTWFGTYRITRSTAYNYRICTTCDKLTKIGDAIYPIMGYSLTILTPIIFGLIKGFTFGGVIGMTFLGFFGGALSGLIINLMYRLIIWLFTNKWMFVNYERAAFYGAIKPLKK